MDLIGDDHRGLPGKRMVWIEDLNLAPQTPGIMTSRRMPAAENWAMLASLIEPASSTASIRKPIWPTC